MHNTAAEPSPTTVHLTLIRRASPSRGQSYGVSKLSKKHRVRLQWKPGAMLAGRRESIVYCPKRSPLFREEDAISLRVSTR